MVIGVDGDDARLAMAKKMGVDVVLDYRKVDVVSEIRRLTGGGIAVAIEALGTQPTFENALRVLRPGGTPPASASTPASSRSRTTHSAPARPTSAS